MAKLFKFTRSGRIATTGQRQSFRQAIVARPKLLVRSHNSPRFGFRRSSSAKQRQLHSASTSSGLTQVNPTRPVATSILTRTADGLAGRCSQHKLSSPRWPGTTVRRPRPYAKPCPCLSHTSTTAQRLELQQRAKLVCLQVLVGQLFR